MPQLDELHQTRSDDGLVVLGLSDEDVELQRKFAAKVEVSYPLLTIEGQVPEMFREIKRYPANFLIDRNGALRPAPGTDRPFDELAQAVDRLLAE
jgi:peroxiredoxin